MIGVTYGAPTEFRAKCRIYEDTITWTPKDIKGTLGQDDLYVQLTFMESMDQFGIDAPAKKYQELFAKAGYHLWCANMQARKNYFDSIFPPASGNPENNFRADDIDFQIEADYIGFMCPGMPRKSNELCDKIGHIMNYGDGVYGGMFVCALYTEAFFESDIPTIIEKALRSIPAESDYAKIIRDVLKLHGQYPNDWKAAWKELDAKWGNVDVAAPADSFNIDAKINGAYIVMGLIYGNGDPEKTLEITTRCGQDSDCNPSNAMAVLGVIKGFSNLPEAMKRGIEDIGDSLFVNTSYSFNKAVASTYNYALQFIKADSGEVSENEIKIKIQEPSAPALEVSFPNVVFDKKVSIFEKNVWKTKGNWQTYKMKPWNKKELAEQAMYADKAGSEIELTFEGTGISIMGNWLKDGGWADVYLDGKLHKSIDTYYFFSEQEHHGQSIWHAFQLQPGSHTVKIIVKGDKRPESLGTKVYICEALVYKTAPKKNDVFKFSFEK